MSEISLEKVGMIEVDRMINLTKFQIQHKYKVTGLGENILNSTDIAAIKKLNVGKEFLKLHVLEEDSDYLIKINGNLN